MTDTIESFISRLQAEGIQAGQAEARKVLEQAQAHAQQTLEQARAEADRIKADAQAQAQTTLQRGRSELELAARDVKLKLQATLSEALRALLASATEKPLADETFLRQLVQEIVTQYAKSDVSGIAVNVAPQMQQPLAHWAKSNLAAGLGGHGQVDVKGTLRSAGFEYTVKDATVEVTPESVTESLAGLVSPELREMLRKAGQ